jgi:hypothetical protein
MTENANRLSRRWFIQGSLLAGAAPQLLLAGAAAAEPAPSAGSAVALPAVPAPNTAPSPTVTLARYGAAFRYEDIPPPVLQRAKDCMTDAVRGGPVGSDRKSGFLSGNAGVIKLPILSLAASRNMPHPEFGLADWNEGDFGCTRSYRCRVIAGHD